MPDAAFVTERGCFGAFWVRVLAFHAAGMQFVPGDIQAFSEGSVRWFAAQLTIKLPDGSPMTARLTGVCHQEDGAWKMVQFHLSFGALNEAAIGEQLTIEPGFEPVLTYRNEMECAR